MKYLTISAIASIVSSMMLMNDDNMVNAWGCPRSCRKVLGDGKCDDSCNIIECLFDGGDCFSSGSYYDYNDYYDDATEAPTPKPTKISKTKSPVGNPTTPSPTSNGVDTTKYNIDIVFVGAIDPKIKEAFMKAKAKWESIIKNDIPNTYRYKKGEKCWEDFTKLSQDKIVDDLMIFAQVARIDGSGGILGQAGPCVTTNEPKEYSRVGLMQFDSSDMQEMVNDGSIDAVILHEMGHVIGIGTLWEDYNLIQRATGSKKNAYYLGEGGIQGLKNIKGTGKPLIETDGGGGTAYGHWDEDTYDNELMTGYAGGDEKFSLLTIESLQDMGFVVDKSKADKFEVPNGKSLRGEDEINQNKKNKHKLGDDVIHKPIKKGEADPY